MRSKIIYTPLGVKILRIVRNTAEIEMFKRSCAETQQWEKDMSYAELNNVFVKSVRTVFEYLDYSLRHMLTYNLLL